MALPARIRIFLLSAALFCVGMAWAAPRRPLDRVRIHALYQDGEFERILRELEAYGRGECSCAKDDSVFAEKHLAVVLAAAPATRELGRYHMFRLLDLSPRADLLDMYVGEEVDAVFEKVRKEHDLRSTDAMAKAQASPASPRPKPFASPRAVASRRAPASAPAALPSQPAYSDAWARASEAGSGPAVRASMAAIPSATHAQPGHAQTVRVQPAPAKAYTRWDAPLADRSAPTSTPDSARAPATHPALAQAASVATIATEADTSRPAWKQPGMWIGGGAAIAAIAFTLWQAGSESGGPGKTYAVPASLSK
jgi:hypothetical protein